MSGLHIYADLAGCEFLLTVITTLVLDNEVKCDFISSLNFVGLFTIYLLITVQLLHPPKIH